MICSFILLPRQLSFCSTFDKVSNHSGLCWRLHPLVLSPPSTTSTSDPILSNDLPITLRKGKCRCTQPISSFCSYNHLSSHSCSFIASLDSISLPDKVSEALAHPGWRSAMIEEMDALTDNGTWDLVLLSIGKEAIGCRWVFTVKVNPNGPIIG